MPKTKTIKNKRIIDEVKNTSTNPANTKTILSKLQRKIFLNGLSSLHINDKLTDLEERFKKIEQDLIMLRENIGLNKSFSPVSSSEMDCNFEAEWISFDKM